MSDFFGDDFTAELKTYFLQSVLAEAQKNTDLIDETTWRRVQSEIQEQAESWYVDAKTNEFIHLAEWFSAYGGSSENFQEAQDVLSALQLLKSYLEALVSGKPDSSDLAHQFTVFSSGKRESLYLHCRTGNQDFVVPVQSVLEISGPLTLSPLPEPQSHFLGVVPFRGEALPVLNLQSHGFQEIGDGFCYYVICEFNGARFSLQVSETDQLVSVAEKDLQSIEGQSKMISAPFIKSFFIRDNHSFMVLDIEKLVA